MYWGMEVYLHAFLTSAVDGGEWSASQTNHFINGVKSSQYPLDRRLGGPQSQSECDGEEKYEPPRAAGSQVTILTVLSRTVPQNHLEVM